MQLIGNDISQIKDDAVMYSTIFDNRPRIIEIDGETFNVTFQAQTVNCPSSCTRCSHQRSEMVEALPKTLCIIFDHENFTLESVSQLMESRCCSCGQHYGTLWLGLDVLSFRDQLEELNPIHIVHSLQLRARRQKIDAMCNPANGTFLAGYTLDRPKIRNLQEFLGAFKGLENYLSPEERLEIQNFVINRKSAPLEAATPIAEELARAGL